MCVTLGNSNIAGISFTETGTGVSKAGKEICFYIAGVSSGTPT